MKMGDRSNSPEFEGIKIPNIAGWYSNYGGFATIKPIEFDGFAFKGGIHDKN
jgi:hypothetical protein